MTQVFNENVEINGSTDTIQLKVKGASSQNSTLQQWLDANNLAIASLEPNGQFVMLKTVGSNQFGVHLQRSGPSEFTPEDETHVALILNIGVPGQGATAALMQWK